MPELPAQPTPASPSPSPSAAAECVVEANANYKGSIVVDGASNVVASAEECCDQCLANPECNTWVFCASADGCYEPYQANECYLKKQADPSMPEAWSRGEFTPWTSGVVLPAEAPSGEPIVMPELPPMDPQQNASWAPEPGVPVHFTPAAAAPSACRTLAPADGMFAGVYGEDPLKPAQYDRTFEQKLGVYGIFVQIPLRPEDRERLEPFMDEVASVGAIALISLEPWAGLQAVTDASMREVAELCRKYEALGAPCIARFAHEANGAWYPWAQQPALFKAKFRAFAEILHAATAHGATMWSVNYGGGYPFIGDTHAALPGSPDWALMDTDGDGDVSMADDPYGPFYPGDDAVDWVGLTLYHWGSGYPYGRNAGPEPGKFAAQVAGTYQVRPSKRPSTRPFSRRLTRSFAPLPQGLLGDERGLPDFHAEYALNRGKPLAVSETAALYNPTDGDAAQLGEAGIKAAWLQQLMGLDGGAAAPFPRLKLVMWFDFKKPEPAAGGVTVDWRILHTAALWDAFAAALAAPVVRGPAYVQAALQACDQVRRSVARPPPLPFPHPRPVHGSKRPEGGALTM